MAEACNEFLHCISVFVIIVTVYVNSSVLLPEVLLA